MVISKALRSKVSSRVMAGAGYAEVSRELGISVGSVHNVVEEEKKNVPDFDELRRLNILLKKNNLTVSSARKGIELAERLRGCGLELADVEDYLGLTEEMLSENGLGLSFVGYALSFKRLAEKYGVSYEDLVMNYQRKQDGANRLKVRILREQAKLNEISAKLSLARKSLGEILVKVEKYTDVHVGLQRLDTDKLGRFVKVLPELEALCFDAQGVKEFGALKLKLRQLNVDSDKLEVELDERGSLEHQNRILAEAVKAKQNRNEEFQAANAELLSRNSLLRAVNEVFDTWEMPVPCKVCGAQVRIRLNSIDYYRRIIEQGLVLSVLCGICGNWLNYSGLEIVFHVASMIFPKTVTIYV